MAKKKGKPRGKAFMGANDPRNGPPVTEQPEAPNYAPKEPKELDVYTETPQDGAPMALQDMRHCWLNAKCFDKTQAHRHARGFLTKDTKTFILQMSKMEEDHKSSQTSAKIADALAAQKQGVASEEIGPDAGGERAMELCRQLIKEAAQRAKGEI